MSGQWEGIGKRGQKLGYLCLPPSLLKGAPFCGFSPYRTAQPSAVPVLPPAPEPEQSPPPFAAGVEAVPSTAGHETAPTVSCWLPSTSPPWNQCPELNPAFLNTRSDFDFSYGPDFCSRCQVFFFFLKMCSPFSIPQSWRVRARL